MSYLIPYVGGKRNMLRNILRAIPFHLRYVELFGGSATVLLAKKPSYLEIYNDKFNLIYNFMKQVKDNHQELYLYIKRMPISYQKINDNDSDIEKAGKFFINTKFFGWGGKLILSTKSSYNTMYKKKISVKDIIRASIRLRDVLLVNEDYKKCIKLYDGDDTFFYCDPPYYLNGKNYYRGGAGWENDDAHLKFYEVITGIKGKFLISYNDCEFIRNLYKGYNIKSFKAVYALSGASHNLGELKYGKEVLISNYEY